MNSRQSALLLNIFPVLRYQDAARAIEWLCEAFGFDKHFVVPGPNNKVAHAELRLGNGFVMLGSTSEDDDNLAKVRVQIKDAQGIYVYVEDVDAHYERARAAGARPAAAPRDTDYGAREYTVRDLEGHIWSFGSYRPELIDA